MRRILLAAALAAVALLPGGARADSYCLQLNLTILGEPYLAHMQCVSCPTTDCPGGPVSNSTADPTGSARVSYQHG